MSDPSASDLLPSSDQENEDMWISPLAAILAIPAGWGWGDAMPEAPRQGSEDLEVLRSPLRPPITSCYTPGAPAQAAQPSPRRPPAPLPAPAPLDAPSDTLSVVNAQLVGGLLAEGPRDPPPPQGKRSWNKRVAITADRFGQEVVQKIADLKAAMDQAINSQSEAARNRAIWLDEESELLLFLRDHEISYIQIAEDYLTRRTFRSLITRFPIISAKRKAEEGKETAEPSINDEQ